jgi:hypothetical protein
VNFEERKWNAKSSSANHGVKQANENASLKNITVIHIRKRLPTFTTCTAMLYRDISQ